MGLRWWLFDVGQWTKRLGGGRRRRRGENLGQWSKSFEVVAA